MEPAPLQDITVSCGEVVYFAAESGGSGQRFD
jgi:hypothetical protein